MNEKIKKSLIIKKGIAILPKIVIIENKQLCVAVGDDAPAAHNKRK